MTFNYTLTKKELLKFNKKYVSNTIKFNKFFIENMVEISLFFFILFIFIPKEFQIHVILSFIEFFVILSLLRKKWYFNYLKKTKFNHLSLYYNLKYLFVETTLSFDKLGISIETIMNKKTIKWKYIKDFHIVEDNVIIRSFSDYDILIPSSAIKSNEILEELIEIVEENTGKCPQYYYPKDIEFI